MLQRFANTSHCSQHAFRGFPRADPFCDRDSDRMPPIAATVPGYEVRSWLGVATSKRVPQPVVERLNRELRTVLEMPDIAPTRCMEIIYHIKGRGGEPVDGVIDNTIHQLAGGEKRIDRIR